MPAVGLYSGMKKKKKKRISIKKIGMEMRKSFSNSGAEINK